MIDPCVPVWCWMIAGEDAVWFARHTFVPFPPWELGYDARDMDVCMLRCEVALSVYHADEATGTHLICGYPVQCGQLAALDPVGRLLCQDHRCE